MWTRQTFIDSQNGHSETLELLIAAQADVGKATQDGATPAFLASEKGGTLRHCNSSLLRGPMWTRQSSLAQPLHSEALELLIAAHANVHCAQRHSQKREGK